MKATGKFPPRVLFTFDDVSKQYGGGEQRTLFRQLVKYRKRKRK